MIVIFGQSVQGTIQRDIKMNNIVNFQQFKQNKQNQSATYVTYDIANNKIENTTFENDDALVAWLYDSGILGYEPEDCVSD